MSEIIVTVQLLAIAVQVYMNERMKRQRKLNNLVLDDIATKLECLQIRTKGDWIYLNEEQPEIGKEVLMQLDNGLICIGHRKGPNSYEASSLHIKTFTEDDTTIVAWQYLPTLIMQTA